MTLMKIFRTVIAVALALALVFAMGAMAFAASEDANPEVNSENTVRDYKAIAAALIIGVAAAAGAIGMAMTIMKTIDGIARQPEAAGNIRGVMMLGLVFIETAIIYALIVAILVVFVL